MNTVGDTIEKVNRLQLKQAVLDEAIQFLAQFIATDSFEPKNGIASPLSGDVIPQDVIEEVKDELFGERVKLETQILELKGQAVSGSVKKAPIKKAPAKKVAKRSPPKRRKPSAQQA